MNDTTALRQQLTADPARVLARLTAMGKVMVVTQDGGVTHERIGIVEKIRKDDGHINFMGSAHDCTIDVAQVACVVVDRSGRMKDKVLPKLELLNTDGKLVFSIVGLQRFLDAVQSVPERPAGATQLAAIGDDLRISNLVLRAPDGRMLLEIPDLKIARGQTIWLSGASGLGKSTLFKALAGLWPHASGSINMPAGRVCILPQQVYLPLDTLSAAAIYPVLPDILPQADADALLHKVGLGHRLGASVEATSGGLSVGEQQRLALARVLARRPDWLFLDEATSALDLESERALMTLLRTELPQTTFVVVAHREPQGLTGVVRIDLSADGVNNITSAATSLSQGNLAVKMG